MDQDETWQGGRPRPQAHCCTQFPLPKNAHTPNLGLVFYGQTAVWITMPLGTEVGLGSADIVYKKASIRWQDSARRQFQAGLIGDVGL